MKKTILTLSLVLGITFLSFGQQKDYRSTLKEMFQISGSEQVYQSAITQMFSMFKQQYTNVDEKTWKGLENEFLKTSMDDLVDMLEPVYKKYMTLADLESMISFYNTPVGKKFAKSTPLIMQESMQIGQQWGMKIAQDFKKRLDEQGGTE